MMPTWSTWSSPATREMNGRGLCPAPCADAARCSSMASTTSAVLGSVTLIVWRQGIPYPVQQSLDPVTGAGWNILSMAGLNNVGQIAATGTKNGVTRALLLTPAPTPTPVP